MIKHSWIVQLIFWGLGIISIILSFILLGLKNGPIVSEYPVFFILTVTVFISLVLFGLITGFLFGKNWNAGLPLNSDNINNGDYEIQFLVKNIYRIRDKGDTGKGLIIFDYACLFSGLPAKGDYPDAWVIVKVETRRIKKIEQVAFVVGENKGDR